MEKFDVIVIGGGSAGYAAARTAREVRERVAIVDSSQELGGLCILRGCMPSKTLIYSTEVLHLAREARLFGLDVPSASVDMKALHERKVRLIDDFKSYRKDQLESDRFSLFRESGRFIDEHTLLLEESGTKLTADSFIIATGSVVNWPKIPGLDSPGIWTSDDVLDLDFLPESVIFLGGGVVACELAQFLHRAGSKVTQVQRSPYILREESNEAAAVIMETFRDEGINLYTGTSLQKIEKTKDGFKVTFEMDGEVLHEEAQYLVNGLGRRPAIDGMDLEKGGVDLATDGKVRIDQFQRTTNPRIYAAGDVCGPFEIVHIAIMQGEVAARHATGREAQPVDLRTRTSVVFTDPQIASAGIPLEEAESHGFEVIAADYPFDDHGKSMLMEARRGYVKVWADREDGRIIGAQCVGKDAGELIHALAVAISMKATAADLLKVHWYHPTLSEIWSYPLEDIAEEIKGR